MTGRGLLLFIIGVTFFGLIFSLYYTGSLGVQNLPAAFQARVLVPSADPEPFGVEEVEEEVNEALADCKCVSNSTGKTYNFCYVNPHNSTWIGKKFDCGHLKFLEKLNLVENPGPFVNLSDPVTNANEMVFVSALSDNHYDEGIGSLEALRKFHPTAKYIVYGLNLNAENAKSYEKFKNVEFRPFNTTGYPDYVNKWMTYRFKPLIIAEVMKEYKNIWWMDAHISVKKPNMTKMLVNEIAEKRKNESQPMPSSVILLIDTGHSNFAVMIPDVLEYFPGNSTLLRQAQLGANSFYLARTEYTVETFKWWVLCALDEKCMNPPGAQTRCKFQENRFDFFANCFRFDQSVLNLLLLNNFQDFNKYYYNVGTLIRT